jgi:CheY-like chemotaxis protein
LLNEFDFAMILMDVKMPVLNGFEAATIIYEREKLRHIPIIFITANNYGDENIFRGYMAGGIDYIFKPINPEVLRAKVAVFMDLYRKNALLLAQEQMLASANKQLEKEINDLKTSEQKMKTRNAKLQKEILALESLIVSINNAEFEQTDLTKLFKSFLDEMDDQENGKMPTVLIEPLPKLRVSHLLMRPLFQNLIRNAIHYGKQDIEQVIRIRPEIDGLSTITNSGNNHNGHYCSIIFEDNGIELDQENNQEIFRMEAGSALNGESDSDSSLVFCKKVMEKHEGFIFAECKINAGSVFVISFPMPQVGGT